MLVAFIRDHLKISWRAQAKDERSIKGRQKEAKRGKEERDGRKSMENEEASSMPASIPEGGRSARSIIGQSTTESHAKVSPFVVHAVCYPARCAVHPAEVRRGYMQWGRIHAAGKETRTRLRGMLQAKIHTAGKDTRKDKEHATALWARTTKNTD